MATVNFQREINPSNTLRAALHVFGSLQHCEPGGIHLGILGRGVPPGSPNPDPISDQNIPFSHPFSDLDSKIHTRFQTFVGS